jgi:hypothetical protein
MTTIENIEVEIIGVETDVVAGVVYLRGDYLETVNYCADSVAKVLDDVERWLAPDIELRSSWKYDILTGKFVVAARVPEGWTYGG